MIHEDEIELLLRLTACDESPPVYVRALVAELRMNEKRACYICQKWTDRGWYDYGVNVLAGWLTQAGKDAAQKMQNIPS